MSTMNIINDAGKPKKRRILLVDDHPLVRVGLASLIRDERDLEICGEASGVGDALQLAMTLEPDLCIIDLSLANGSGLTLIKTLRLHVPNTLLLVCSMHDETLFAQRVLSAGAKGYINKQEATDHVVDAVRRVLDGKIYLSEAMTDRILVKLSGGSVNPLESPIASLSDRELEIFELIGRGYMTSQIAKQLHISVKTVETHREKIKKKLTLSSAAELTRTAMKWITDDF